MHFLTYFPRRKNSRLLTVNVTRTCLIVSVAVLVFSCATSNEQIKKAEAYYKLGVAKVKEGRYQEAFIQFQKAKMLTPEDKRIHYALGIVYQQFGQIKEAEASYKKALEIDDKYSEALNSLGLLYMKTKRYKEAEGAFLKALQNPLYETPEQAITNLGLLYYRQGRFLDAEKQFKIALRRRPDYYPAYYGLALCYRALGMYSEASEALEEAIKLDPTINGNREKAFEYFTKQKLLADNSQDRLEYEALIEILYY